MAVTKSKFFFSILFLGVIGAAAFWGTGFFVKPAPVEPLSVETLLEPENFKAIEYDFKSMSDIESWRHHSFTDETHYSIHDEGDGSVSLKAVSEATSLALFKAFDVNIQYHPIFSWEWKVTKFPTGKKREALTAKADDDFAGRIYAIFKSKIPYRNDVIQYVWDDHFKEGTSGPKPFFKNIKVLVIRRGLSEEGWVREERDLYKDYQMLFGKDPERNLIGIGLMSDSDNTKSSSEAYFRHFRVEVPAENIELMREDEALKEKPFLKRFGEGLQTFIRDAAEGIASVPKSAMKRLRGEPVEELSLTPPAKVHGGSRALT